MIKAIQSAAFVVGCQFVWVSMAWAQDATPVPEGLRKTDAASSGSTDVALAGFEAAPKSEPSASDARELELSAGGLGSAGNSRSIAFTAGGKYRLRMGPDQFTALAAGNYARAGKQDKPMDTTVENLQGRVRYDRFLAGDFAVFGAASARNDRFQGLDLRLNLDPGVAYYFIDAKHHQLWGELGYDFQYDVRRQETIDAAFAQNPPIELAKTNVRHSGRAFVGWDLDLRDGVAFSTGLEYIQGVQDTKNFRINWDAGIHSSIGHGFSVATTVAVKYDNNPLPGILDTDTVTAVSLVYKMH